MVPAVAAVVLVGYVAWLTAVAWRAATGRSAEQAARCATLAAMMHVGYVIGFLAVWLSRRPSAGLCQPADGVMHVYRIKSFGERWSSGHEGLLSHDVEAVAADAWEPVLTT
jgi:hypothetical protein